MKKICLTVSRRNSWPEVKMFFNAAPTGAPIQHLNQIGTNYPFLPKSYLNLIKKYDGLDIGWFLFYGSGVTNYPSYTEILNHLATILDLENMYPFAKDAGGNPLLIRSDAKISIFNLDESSAERELILCDSFDSIMENGFFGSEFTQIFYGRPWRASDDQGWVGYLKKAGWY